MMKKLKSGFLAFYLAIVPSSLFSQLLVQDFIEKNITGDSYFGQSVSSAGDVNGDGYDDILVSAPAYNNYTGRVYVFLGADSVKNEPDFIFDAPLSGLYFGVSAASAGDVNGDGYCDIIIGCPNYSSSTGSAYIYFGGENMDTDADVIMTGQAPGSNFGSAVAKAGDVNDDGFDDVIVGAFGYNSYYGRAYIIYGGINMGNSPNVYLYGATNSQFGASVSSAGDINGDGFDDVLVGARMYNSNTGRAYIFYGGSSMDNVADMIIAGETAGINFGNSVSSAGDVNGDGFDDIIVGAQNYNTNAGRVYIYFGSGAMDDGADIIFTGEYTYNLLGAAVTGGADLNADGFDDVVVGASGYNGQTGRVYVLFGGAEMDNVPDVVLNGEAGSAYFGNSLSIGGDVNNDGFSDIIIGAYAFNNYSGRAYFFTGGETFDEVSVTTFNGEGSDNYFGSSASFAGDVNGDGIDDIIVGARAYNNNTGRAYIYFGGITADSIADIVLDGETFGSRFGYSVAGAGDVNGDGFADIIVGAIGHNSNLGRAYIYFGGPAIDNVADLVLTGLSAGSYFGCSVSSAGDYNSDGFDDIFVGAYNPGNAYLYLGGASMDNVHDLTFTGGFGFGWSVSGAGDVNNDGFDDIVVGENYYSTNTGRAYLFYGGNPMNSSPDVYFNGPETNSYFGCSVSALGDVNGDGFDDFVIGAYGYNSQTGGAYVYFGGSSMDGGADLTLNGEATGSWFGNVVSAAGDINADGFDDVLIGAPRHNINSGRSYLYLGGGSMDAAVDFVFTGESAQNEFGMSVASAGDFNNDTYPDILIGAASVPLNGEVYIYTFVLPVISTQPVNAITATTATGHATLNYLGTTNPSDHGFCWNTSGNPDVNDSIYSLGAVSVIGSFTGSLTQLLPNTNYFVRSFATNASGTVYGNEVSFTTLKLNQTISFDTLTNVTYGDNTFNLTATASSGLTVSYTSSNTNVATISGNTVTVIGAGTTSITASQEGNNNYYAASDVVQTLTVDKATLTVTADDKTKTYGEDNPLLTFVYSGWVNGVETIDEPPVVSTTIDETSHAGEYADAITVSGGADNNYVFNYLPGSFEITKATLTVTAENKTKTYGGANPLLTFVYSGWVNGVETIDEPPVVSTTIDETSVVGDYADAITVSGGADNNYVFNYVPGSFEITKATLTVTADNKTKTYGGANPALTFVYTGWVNGVETIDEAPVASTTIDETSHAGEYAGAITVSGGTDNNYSFSYVPG
ncbi:MAG: FG-GAP repeat protein, partial [Bacteroidales bacterium]|nr:FG-GAP repeat protein [Bacteroidales bacterium]